MKRRSRIRIASSEVGLFPESLTLNRRFRPDVQRIKLAVEIEWEPFGRSKALGRLEESLVALSPTLRQHECFGQSGYRILRGLDGRRREADVEVTGIELPLAVAHLLEHLMIDMVATLTGESLISGATGARWDSRQRFDIFVECPDVAVAPLVVRLSVSWMKAMLAGRELDGTGRPALELAQQIYAGAGRGFDPTAWARRQRRDPHRVASALRWLQRNGFVRREKDRVFYGVERLPARPRAARRKA